MADIVTPEVRSRMMSGIRGKNTKPEIVLRKALHARGFRYRIHDRTLPGRPDIVLPKWKAVILVQGCFWHGHDCSLFRMPSTRQEFWCEKIEGNRARDARNREKLINLGWRVLEVWECATRGGYCCSSVELVEGIDVWLRSSLPVGKMSERPHKSSAIKK
ncbi:very short patch repair endonuclease [Asaia lannensis]|uniref:Very short patch repair endonuclease n=1 Tax=Asaia lannensis NBRC 102526 TaxID=1307926 RepID=A0ABT1CJG3_9PROT|nr:very short patch repair endonuclease [Asaia lannensis]MCO6161014.1 very short patch repair endonuclease [Asaia lannensis NBRC 102526]